MARRRLVEPILLSLLVPLLATLAVLQIRWATKAAAADAEQMKASLERAGKQLAGEVTDQVSVVEWLFQVDPADLAAGRFASLRDQWAFWNERAAYPDLVSGVVILVTSGGTLSAQWLDPSRGTTGPVPAGAAERVKALQDRVQEADVAGSSLATLVNAGGATDGPAALIPVYGMSLQDVKGLAAGGVMVRASAYVAVLLDPDVLFGEVLPAFVNDAFSGDIDRKSYQVVIRDVAAGTVLFPRGAAAPALAQPADLEVPIFSTASKVMVVSRTVMPDGGQAVQGTEKALDVQDTLAFMKLQRAAAGLSGKATAGGISSSLPSGLGEVFSTQSAAAPGGWLLTVTHRAGSLDRAARLVVLRNLSVSLGILAVLAASLALLYLSFRRARATSQRQRAFVASVSHELRTPLSVIYAAGENLCDGVVAGSEKVRGYGALIRDEGTRLRDMVEKVISLSRERAGGRRRGAAAAGETVDIAAMVRDVAAAEAGRCAARALACSVDGAEGAVMIAGADEAGLHALVRNLVENAIVHGGAGGVVRIGLAVRRARRGGEAVITVADRGPGIPASDVDRLFEPFERGEAAVNGQVPGSGLGLAIAREAAKAHGGSIRMESTPGAGATFTVVLPLGGRRRA